MKLRTTTTCAGRITRVSSLVVIAASLTTSCAGSPDEGPELSAITSQVPAIAAMVEGARTAPPQRSADGLVVRSMARPVAGPDVWNQAAKPVLATLDAETGGLVVRTTRSAEIGVTRLGGAALRPQVEDGVVVRRDSGDRIRSVVMARPNGVEELLLQHEAGEAVGYELDLPRGWSLRQPEGWRGVVEIRDSRGKPRMRVVADVAWDADGRELPVTARVDGPKIHFTVPADAALPVVIDPEWQDTGSPAKVRARSTATILQDGRVLLVGGLSGADDILSDEGEVLCTTELYDPLDLSWQAGPVIPGEADGVCTAMMDHVAVPLIDGTVLVAGGANLGTRVGARQPAALRSAFRYDPRADTFTAVGAMNIGRVHHAGTLLPSGQVLISGGSDRVAPLSETTQFCPAVGDEECERCVGLPSAELFDPATGNFTPVAMPTPRACHTATRLADGSVLLVGGGGEATDRGAAGFAGEPVAHLSLFRDGEVVDLPTRLQTPRLGHIAVLRPDAAALLVAFGRDRSVIGGDRTDGVAVAELIDVDAITSDAPPEMARPVPCGERGAGEGGAGGGDHGGGGGAGGDELPDAPAGRCPVGRAYAAAVLTRSGKVLVVGGQEQDVGGTKASLAVDTFDFDSAAFDDPPPPQLPAPASKPVLTLLPTGKILLVGQTAPAELIDDTAWHLGESEATLAQGRAWQTATPLPDGTLFLAGGYSGQYDDEGSVAARDTAELLDPTTMTSTLMTTAMTSRRVAHTATYLGGTPERRPSVLLAGGARTWKLEDAEGYIATATAELFDVDSRAFTPTGTMAVARIGHAAVRLPSGQVLVMGGVGDGLQLLPPSAELYDPASGTFTTLDAPAFPRVFATATLLGSGEVLIAGGFATWGDFPEPTAEQAAAEIFDPVTRSFRTLEGMVVARGAHTATPLPDGSVLIAGGSAISAAAEIFDPSSETFRVVAGTMTSPRLFHAAVMLPSGQVLLSGGSADINVPPRADAELFDPVTGQFEPLVPDDGVAQPRFDHEAVLMSDGRVALVGGSPDARALGVVSTIGIVTPAGAAAAPGADLVTGPASASPGSRYAVSGLSLSSYWETSSGPYASPTNAPIAVWMPPIGTPVLGTFAPWSEGEATWTPPSSPYAGEGYLFAARHGQSSVGLPVTLERAPQGVPCTTDAACASGFCSDGVCCDERCHVAGDGSRACRACSVPKGAEVDGTCNAVAEDTDPHEDCVQAVECAPSFAVCGGDGQCKECRCASRVDCADGYSCTAEGRCEKPVEPRLDAEACALGARPITASSDGDLAWLGVAGAFAMWRARRRGRSSRAATC